MTMSDSNYLDFDIQIGPGVGREYPVDLINSPAGETRGILLFPYDELALQSRLKDLQIALLRSGGIHRQMLLPEQQNVQDFGQALFDALIKGEIRSRFDVSQREAVRQGKGLRLKLRILPPELSNLPWEYLYDPRQGEFICLSRTTPLIRYLELPKPAQPLVSDLPLRILGMIVSPRDLPHLDVQRERQRMEEAIKQLVDRGVVEMQWLEGLTWRDLQREMRSDEPWHVFHFIGHGGFNSVSDEGFIALGDEKGNTHMLYASELGRLLADHSSLRLVFLNACEGALGGEKDIFSSTASILLRRGIPAVVAMQYAITDRAAVEFSSSFYEALASGMPVDASVTEARKSVSLAVSNTLEWGTPVLYMHSPDGLLFRFQPIVKPIMGDSSTTTPVSTSAEAPLLTSTKPIAKQEPQAISPKLSEPVQPTEQFAKSTSYSSTTALPASALGCKLSILIWLVPLALILMFGTYGVFKLSPLLLRSPTPIAIISPSSPTNTPIPTLSQTATLIPTLRPNNTPTVGLFPVGFVNNCINSSTWYLPPGSSMDIDNNHCWVLEKWGMYVKGETLTVSVSNPTSVTRPGIYTPLQGDATVEYDIVIDNCYTPQDNVLTNLAMGVIAADPYTLDGDGQIFYQRESPQAGYPIFIKSRERGGKDKYIALNGEMLQYAPGTSQHLLFTLSGNRLAIYLDNQLILNGVNIPSGQRGFWIGYRLAPGGSLEARISNFSLQK